MFETIVTAATAGSIALSGGGTGLLSIPSAQLMPANTVTYQYSDGLLSIGDNSPFAPRMARAGKGMTDHLQFSVIPHMEFGLRLTTLYQKNQRRRILNDLSGHLKIQALQTKNFRLALGARDFAGEAANLAPAEFIVGDVYGKNWQLVAGYGRSDHAGVALGGAFGGIRYSPYSWIDLLVDYDAVAVQAGFNLHASHAGYSVFLKGYYTSQKYQDFAFATGIRLPFGQTNKYVPKLGELLWALKQPHAYAVPHTRDAIWHWPASDGLALTYGNNLLAAESGICGKEMLYSSHALPLMRIGCIDSKQYQVNWAHSDITKPAAQRGAMHAQLRLEPVQQFNLGSEVGRLDYSLALRSSLQVFLPGGFSAHAAWDTSLAKSDDYQRGGAFSDRAHQDGLTEAALQFSAHLFNGFLIQATAGRSKTQANDVVFSRGEIAWMLWDGHLGLHYNYTVINPEQAATKTQQSIGRAFVWLKPAQYAAQLAAGRYLHDHTGLRLDLYRYLGRARIGVFYKDGSRPDQKAAGLTVTVPLGGVIRGRWFSVAGTPHYDMALETQVDTGTGINNYRPNFLREFRPQRSLIPDILDNWRASPVYVRNR